VENLLDPKGESIELLEFFKKKDVGHINPRFKQNVHKIQKFMQKMIQLYANLCAGRNYNVINKIKEVLN